MYVNKAGLENILTSMHSKLPQLKPFSMKVTHQEATLYSMISKGVPVSL